MRDASAAVRRLQGMLVCCSGLESRFHELAIAASVAEPAAPQLLSVENAAEVAESGIHGRGLRASRDLAPGSLVTFYPVHAIGDTDHALTLDDTGHFDRATTWPYRLSCTHAAFSDASVFRDAKVWLDANPEAPLVAGWLGHMVNDCATVSSGSDSAVEAYYATAQEEANVVLVPLADAPPLMGWVARCAIPRGAECVGTYGHDFWLSRDGGTVPPYTARVLQAAKSGWKTEQRRAQKQATQRYEHEIALLGALLESAVE